MKHFFDKLAALLVERFAHAHVLTRFIIDETAGLMAIEMSRADDELGHIEGKETVGIETAGIALGQHESFCDTAVGVDVTEIRAGEEPVVTAGTQHEPA